MTVYGKVLDSTTRAPIPGATVAIYSGNIRLSAVAASGAGEFTIMTLDSSRPDRLGISSVGYTEKFFDISAAVGTNTFMLNQDIKDLPPVIVTSSSKKNWWWLLLFIPFIIKKR
ncbi:MAG: carboxypeptidase-like regulatory domain-containing protein [Bacteroidota bacterium]